MKINEDKAKQGIDRSYNVAEYAIDKYGDLLIHIANQTSMITSSFMLAIVSALSALPEMLGVAQVSGSFSLGLSSAAIGVSLAYLAIRLPVIKQIYGYNINILWVLYGIQFFASEVNIIAYGGGPQFLTPWFSAIGAITAAYAVEEVERKMKQRSAATNEDLDAQLKRDLKRASHEQTLAHRRAKMKAEYGTPKAEMSDKKAAISPVNGAVGTPTDDMTKIRTGKKAKRQQQILAAMNGQVRAEFVEEMTGKFEVKERTIHRDLLELGKTGKASVNGNVKRTT